MQFSNLKLRSKLLALAVAATVVTLALGAFAQASLLSERSSSNAIVVVDAKPALQLNRATLAYARFRRNVLELIAAQSDAQNKAAAARIDANRKEALDAMDGYLQSAATADSRAKAEAIKALMVKSLDVYDSQLADAATKASTPEEVAAVNATLDRVFSPIADEEAKQSDALLAQDSSRLDADLSTQAAAASGAVLTLWAVAIVGSLVILGFGFWISGLIVRPVLRVRDALEAMATGDLTRSSNVTGGDEIGQMASALDRAQASLRDVMASIGTSSATLAGSAEELSAVSAQVANSAAETSTQSNTAAAAAEQVSRSVQTVAAATEEMSSSIREISQSSSDAVRIAQSAASEAVEANATVAKLGDSSRQIGDVVKVITSIAEQTNLLALNATIEAARAGEAGKGFAVVASEVKDLAQETARATGDISQRIEAIQADTDAAVAAIGRIATIIDEVNTYQTTIASAVEEQSATTAEMSRNVAQAADGSTSIAQNIEVVASAAQSSSTGIGEAQRSASELAQLSSELRELVSRFRI